MNSFYKLCMALLASAILVESVTITQKEFNDAATKNGFKSPPREYYDYFVEAASKYSKEEQAMLLAQILHESEGLTQTEKQECMQQCDKFADEYKKYFGRGFLPITWEYNYKRASKALGLGDKLVREPEIVSKDKRIAMLVSIWFWDTYVTIPLKGNEDRFGVTTFYINSDECRYLKYRLAVENRWEIYSNVADAFGIENKAKEIGCYN